MNWYSQKRIFSFPFLREGEGEREGGERGIKRRGERGDKERRERGRERGG